MKKFSGQVQQEDYWCWAAVVSSISNYYNANSSWTQCKLASVAFYPNDCCKTPGSAQCNQGYDIGKALAMTNNLAGGTASKVPFSTIQTEIDNCRPLGVDIDWNTAGYPAHAVVIIGYSGTNIIIFDPSNNPPWGGVFTVDYASFPTNYGPPVQGGATWDYTYYTKA